MNSTERRPAAGAPIQQADETWTQSYGRPWDQVVDWHKDPATAYLRGLQDGIRLGLDDADRILREVLAEALGADDLAEAIRGSRDRNGLISWRDQLAARGGRGWVA